MAYAITHLTGRAHLWGAEDWDRQMPAYSSFQAFAAELRKVFGRGFSRPATVSELLTTLHQVPSGAPGVSAAIKPITASTANDTVVTAGCNS